MPAIELYPHQKEALGKLRNGSVLCGGVGSGKSRTSIAYYFLCQGGDLSDSYKKMPNPKDLYIITTAQKRDTCEWEKELLVFNLSVHPETSLYSNKVVVDSWNNIGKYIGVKGAFFIFDEQRVVGKGAWEKSFEKITAVNEWILLSATPGDKWTDYIAVFIANGFYKNRTQFMHEHVVLNRFVKYEQVDRYINTRKLARLRDRILVDMDFDRTVKKEHKDVYVEYDIWKTKEIMKERWNVFENKPIRNASELCYILRHITNADDSRIEMVERLMKEHPRAIIFYNFDYELELLRAGDYPEGTEIAEWNGHKHQPIPNSKRWVYLVQYNAGSEGWNCIKTDTLIFYSQNYSYRTMVQAAGRIDRLNTPYSVLYYYHLKSRAPIDLAISRALSTKKQFNEQRFFKKVS